MVLGVLGMPAYASDATDKIIDDARKDCQSFENGVLEVSADAISLVDLTGNGVPDEVVDASHFSCSSAASLFCGTGGCAVSVVAEGVVGDYLAKGWRVTDWDGQPILLLAVHGSLCGGANPRRCIQAVIWSEGGLRSIGDE